MKENHIWYPCTQMKEIDLNPLPNIKKAKGSWLIDKNNNKYLDAISSWWVNLFGHNNPEIKKAINRQLNKFEHIIFSNFTHDPAIKFTDELVKVLPKGLEKVLFSSDGSSAVEMALKLSFQYHKQTNNRQKNKFISITNSYHGETIGALSVGNIDIFTKTYKPLIKQNITIQGPECTNCIYKKNRLNCNAECFENIEKEVQKNHNKISAIIIEPMVQCAAGMKIYNKTYLKKIRDICNQYNINLIADEIAVGFGRTGKMFACEHANISPDIITLSKGITGGFLPLSVTVCTKKIYDAFYDDYEKNKSFLHSHSYSGNPIACAAALETLKIFKNQQILNKINQKSLYMQKQIEQNLNNIPKLKEYRHIGLIHVIEINNKTPRFNYEIHKKALKKWLLIRPIGNNIYFMPPYTIKNEEIDFIIHISSEILKK